MYMRGLPMSRFQWKTHKEGTIIVVPHKHYMSVSRWACMYDMEEELVANYTLKTINAQLSRLDTKAWPMKHPNAALTEFPMTPDHTLNDISGFGGA